MSGRGRGGRGGGRGSGNSLNREQLTSIGVLPGEALPGPITEPPPAYPSLNRKPVPLRESLEVDYLLILRQDFIDHIQTSGAFLRLPENRQLNRQQEIDKLLAQLPSIKEKFDWQLFPSELRPKVIPKRCKTKNVKNVDIDSRLKQLEQIENKTTDVMDITIKEEVEPEEEEQLEENYEDEDIDEGTDYANNYFDNGEAYEDEDDNLDDGPCY